jgi:hypothetical protein
MNVRQPALNASWARRGSRASFARNPSPNMIGRFIHFRQRRPTKIFTHKGCGESIARADRIGNLHLKSGVGIANFAAHQQAAIDCRGSRKPVAGDKDRASVEPDSSAIRRSRKVSLLASSRMIFGSSS